MTLLGTTFNSKVRYLNPNDSQNGIFVRFSDLTNKNTKAALLNFLLHNPLGNEILG